MFPGGDRWEYKSIPSFFDENCGKVFLVQTMCNHEDGTGSLVIKTCHGRAEEPPVGIFSSGLRIRVVCA